MHESSQLKKAAGQGIALLRGPSGFTLTPQREGKLLSLQEFGALPEKDQQRFTAAMGAMKEQLKTTMSRIPEWQREMRQHFQALDRETVPQRWKRDCDGDIRDHRYRPLTSWKTILKAHWEVMTAMGFFTVEIWRSHGLEAHFEHQDRHYKRSTCHARAC
jgi:hypothetical protein